MADAKHGEDGRLGPYRLGRRYGSKNPEMEDLGRLYEAHNVHTDASALVLVPAPGVCEEPEEDWRVRITAQARPPHVAVEVEHAPASGELAALAGLFEVLTRMMERMEWSDETRRHLTRAPEGRLKRWAAEARRVLGTGVEYGVELSIVALVLLLVAAHWRVYIESKQGAQHEVAGVAGAALEASTTWVDRQDTSLTIIGYSMPDTPLKGQMKPPCLKGTEVEIRGGCWVQMKQDAPCPKSAAEYEGKCYVPVSEKKPEPRSILP